jgi:hypothetical protein
MTTGIELESGKMFSVGERGEKKGKNGKIKFQLCTFMLFHSFVDYQVLLFISRTAPRYRERERVFAGRVIYGGCLLFIAN